MNQFILERNVFEVFNKATSLNTIEYNLDDLNNNFEYLFLTISLLIYDVN